MLFSCFNSDLTVHIKRFQSNQYPAMNWRTTFNFQAYILFISVSDLQGFPDSPDFVTGASTENVTFT